MSAPRPRRHSGLLLFSGVDAPGQSDAIFTALASYSIEIIDIEQVVIQKRLLLTILISVDPAHTDSIEKEMSQVAASKNLDFAAEFIATQPEFSFTERLHLVILGSPLSPMALSTVAHAIATKSGNIDRIHRTVSYPVTAFEFLITLNKETRESLIEELTTLSHREEFDFSIENEKIRRGAKRLVLLDVDSTLIQQEVIDLLAKRTPHQTEVSRITDQAMRGELDFDQALRARVSLLKGLPESVIADVRSEISLSPGAKTLVRTLHHLGHKVGIVSGGFIDVIAPLADDLNLDFVLANKLEINQGKLTGNVLGEIINRKRKAQALRDFAKQEGVDITQTVAVGDGANDLDMIDLAGLGIAFNAKPVLRESADSSITNPYLDSVLYLLGITREQVTQALL
jgi:phosphoserine phosphatase